MIIIGSAFTAAILVDMVKSDTNVTTQFNFPRHMSMTEITNPPPIQKNVRYTLISSDPGHQGREINWTRIIERGPYEVVIIGDSFLTTRGGANLCKKISVENNVSVLHIFVNDIGYGDNNPNQLLILLTNNGFLKKAGARVVILEEAERVLPGLVLKVKNFSQSDPLPTALPAKKTTSSRDIIGKEKRDTSVFSKMNESIGQIDNYFSNSSRDLIILKTWVKNVLLSQVGSKSDDGALYFLSINESRFTNPLYASRLIFYRDDINAFHNSYTVYPDDCIRMNDNLNTIAGKLRNQNITLIFVPVVSAYNMYYPYTINPPSVRNPLFEILRVLDRSYVLIDTKAIADTLQKKGVKDLSGIGDPAHWTWRLAEAVSKEINLRTSPGQHQFLNDKNEEYNRAVQAFRAVMYERSESHDPWAYKMDGMIYERTNDSLNATRYYLYSLELDARQPDLRVRLERVMKNISQSGQRRIGSEPENHHHFLFIQNAFP